MYIQQYSKAFKYDYANGTISLFAYIEYLFKTKYRPIVYAPRLGKTFALYNNNFNSVDYIKAYKKSI